jgi:hypothetical protein
MRSGDQIEIVIVANDRHRRVFRHGVEPHPTLPGYSKGDETKWVWEVV